MILNVFSIYDVKAKLYSAPFFNASNVVAYRLFDSMKADTNSLISKYPDDYVLHFIGTFNDETSVLTHVNPVVVDGGLDG